MLNIYSNLNLGALRTRSKKSTKIDTLTNKIKNLESKSTNLEQQNTKLKTDKQALEQQVQELLSILNKVKSGDADSDLHKRFKTSEFGEQPAEPNESGSVTDKADPLSDSSSFPCEGEESELFSLAEDQSGVVKIDNWLNQNDILNQVVDSNEKSSKATQLIEKNENLDKFMLKRENDDQDVLGSIFGDSVGNFFSQASMLSLTVVMCLIL
jgi:predicted ribosome quality control (RQC) complex YloA/Tae2 family protein